MKTRNILSHRNALAVLAVILLACCDRSPLLDAPDGATGGAAGSGGDAGFKSCSGKLPLPSKPCIDCAPLPAGDSGGCAAPDISIFNWHGGGVDTSLRYPVGCTVYLPTENPYYPGGPQPCSCSAFGGPNAAPSWACPI